MRALLPLVPACTNFGARVDRAQSNAWDHITQAHNLGTGLDVEGGATTTLTITNSNFESNLVSSTTPGKGITTNRSAVTVTGGYWNGPSGPYVNSNTSCNTSRWLDDAIVGINAVGVKYANFVSSENH